MPLFDAVVLFTEVSKVILVTCGWIGCLGFFVWYRDKEMQQGKRFTAKIKSLLQKITGTPVKQATPSF